MTGINILIVAQEKKLADTLRQGLSENGFFTQVAYDGVVGLRLFRHGIFSLVIIDSNLHGLNGPELSKAIRNLDPRVPVIMLTTISSAGDKIEGYDSGADDYVVRPFEFKEVLQRVRELLGRVHTNVETGVQLKAENLVVNPDTKEVTRSGQPILLTEKEFELLEYMLRNKNRMLSHVDIALNVWDFSFGGETNVIDVYVNYLRRKIDRDFATPLIHTKVGEGYILKDPGG